MSWKSWESDDMFFFFEKTPQATQLHHRQDEHSRGLVEKGHDSGLCIELGSEGEAPKSVAGFSSAISACEKNGHWQIALEILTESLSSKRSASVIGWTIFRKIF